MKTCIHNCYKYTATVPTGLEVMNFVYMFDVFCNYLVGNTSSFYVALKLVVMHCDWWTGCVHVRVSRLQGNTWNLNCFMMSTKLNNKHDM